MQDNINKGAYLAADYTTQGFQQESGNYFVHKNQYQPQGPVFYAQHPANQSEVPQQYVGYQNYDSDVRSRQGWEQDHQAHHSGSYDTSQYYPYTPEYQSHQGDSSSYRGNQRQRGRLQQQKRGGLSHHGRRGQGQHQQSRGGHSDQRRNHQSARSREDATPANERDTTEAVAALQIDDGVSGYTHTERQSFLDYMNSDLLDENYATTKNTAPDKAEEACIKEKTKSREKSRTTRPDKDAIRKTDTHQRNGAFQSFQERGNSVGKNKFASSAEKQREASRGGARQKQGETRFTQDRGYAHEKTYQERRHQYEKVGRNQERFRQDRSIDVRPAGKSSGDRGRLLRALELGDESHDNKIWTPRGVAPRNRSQDARLNTQTSPDAPPSTSDDAARDDPSQMGMLTEQLTRGTYECMVCCERVWQSAAIWSCAECYHVFHLRCVRRWAQSAASGSSGVSGWRCPACQNTSEAVPSVYRCFCGRATEPVWNRRDAPHTCGEPCSKRRGGGCPHPCGILCHPGPCPPCGAVVTKSCLCGKRTQTTRCGQQVDVRCEEACGCTLDCVVHACVAACHAPPCEPCAETRRQACHCGATTRDVRCGSQPTDAATGEPAPFACGQTCGRDLACGNHTCERACHPGACDDCTLTPANQTRCPCGQRPLVELEAPARTSCLDAVATCGQVCGKPLLCGPEGKRHRCGAACHEGACAACDKSTSVRCHCGALEKEVPCRELAVLVGEKRLLCNKRCKKKLDCGRHKCIKHCCTDEQHKCEQVCNRKLPCGLHSCEESCHRGNCPSCWHASFDELRCHCGVAVIYPPVACGTTPPECARPCSRQHDCEHAVMHPCHADARCPPCTHLTIKWCNGGHEQRHHIACHVTNVSCGRPCAKPLPCGCHTCLRTCHAGVCRAGDAAPCAQPCAESRDDCGHACAAPCHAGAPCAKTPCRQSVEMRCVCKTRVERLPCWKRRSLASKMAASLLGARVSEMQAGEAVSIDSMLSARQRGEVLECNEECALIERNRRVALALQIVNPELTNRLGNPSYSPFLREFAKKNLAIAAAVERQLTELVQEAKKSKLKQKSFSFPVMNREQRHLVNELAEYYGCATVSYDVEPKKNVVATAERDKCFMPSVSLVALAQREMHGPKCPMPIPHNATAADKIDQLKAAAKAANQSTAIMGATSGEITDYFDMT
ncbi:PREDICTED: transcriptional repressor NF-X1-like [Priapulus caudatus]|uniref:Transcriptional repressor NF-X1-like n=1 Tax=Priapulus caudatus TaxID=37621 RepID=A0ABM1DXC0_PRICU|nr:PREDICTED: transcriptional repressor NF-X1-like [Priapulus caudatus]XP_014664591.1 PREDICTED: transcriptional repressor NF-X1-like [Priapulus caudatus]